MCLQKGYRERYPLVSRMSNDIIRVAVTGHRPEAMTPETLLWVRQQIRRVLLRAMRKYGDRLRGATGMARGVDMIFAEECEALGIPFAAYVPFAGQSSKWSKSEQRRYRELLRQAEFVEIVCDGDWSTPRDNWKFLRRNEVMLDEAHVLLSVWSGSTRGGTAHAVRHWRKTHRKHIWIHSVEHRLGWWREPTSLSSSSD